MIFSEPRYLLQHKCTINVYDKNLILFLSCKVSYISILIHTKLPKQLTISHDLVLAMYLFNFKTNPTIYLKQMVKKSK